MDAVAANRPWPKGDGDFISLLHRENLWPFPQQDLQNTAGLQIPVATTVLGFHYKDGVVIAGDRRATAGNVVMYDRADKVIQLDSHTVMAIAGTPATAFEMARVLQHSFQYYRRSQLQALSLEAKVRALGKLLKDNMALALQGVGLVVPILAGMEMDEKAAPRLYFYDALGAQFQAVDFAVSGSGSPAARSILHYINRWSGKPTIQRDETESVALAIQLLDVAAESDTATGGIDRRTQIYPQVYLLTKDGVRVIDPEVVSRLAENGGKK
jgi:proteasome beta subunit